MHSYLVLVRAINVGGNNIVSMAELREWLEAVGYSNVSTFLATGNLILKSNKSANQIKHQIERDLPKKFKVNDNLIKVRVLSHDELQAVIDTKPKGFGDQPKKYHSDVIFLMDFDADEAMKVFKPRDGVDKVWKGDGVIYSQRLSAMRTKSRLSKIVGTPAYKSMTIRTYGTTNKLLGLLTALER